MLFFLRNRKCFYDKVPLDSLVGIKIRLAALLSGANTNGVGGGRGRGSNRFSLVYAFVRESQFVCLLLFLFVLVLLLLYPIKLYNSK